MNTIAFAMVPDPDPDPNPEGDRGELVEIRIDGRSLIELLREYELPMATREGEGYDEIAGGYAWLTIAFAPSHRFLGDNASDSHRPRTTILVCGACGDHYCWPMICRISVGPDVVIWSDFVQIHRSGGNLPPWDYTGFGPFTFDRAEYEAALFVISG